jgi:amino acid transporter
MNPEDTIPKAISLCYVTVTVISMFVLVSGVGAVSIIDLLHSEAPLMDGIELVYGEGSSVSDAVAYVIVLGLIVNFFSFILFASQQIQSIADAGFLPAFLAYRHPVYSSPIYASIVSSSTGLLFCVCFSFILSEDMAQNVLLMAALMAAILSYMLVLECIVRIRNVEHRIKDIEDDSSEFPKQVLAVTDAELHSLGNDPQELRFFYNAFGARWGQLMCVMLAAGLLTLCSTSYDYMYGLIVLVLLGSIMLWTISRISSRRHRLDLDDSAAAHSTTRDNSDSLKRLLNNWGGNKCL